VLRYKGKPEKPKQITKRQVWPKVRRATFGDDSSSYHLNGGVTAVPKSERDCPAALKLALQEWECFPIIRWICAFLNSATSATFVKGR